MLGVGVQLHFTGGLAPFRYLCWGGGRRAVRVHRRSVMGRKPPPVAMCAVQRLSPNPAVPNGAGSADAHGI